MCNHPAPIPVTFSYSLNAYLLQTLRLNINGTKTKFNSKRYPDFETNLQKICLMSADVHIVMNNCDVKCNTYKNSWTPNVYTTVGCYNAAKHMKLQHQGTSY